MNGLIFYLINLDSVYTKLCKLCKNIGYTVSVNKRDPFVVYIAKSPLLILS